MKPETINWDVAAERLAWGEVGVVPTDTLYGVVASAIQPTAVEKVYELRRRERDKPMIVLIGGWDDFERFQISLDERTHNLLNKVWPGPVSVIVAAASPALAYLHRGTGSVAFRMPLQSDLQRLLQAAGPLVAPSANVAGETPATSVGEAYDYFGEQVFYVDGGRLSNPPSALVDSRTSPPRILRPAPGFRIEY